MYWKYRDLDYHKLKMKFNKTFIINLRKRPDRMEAFRQNQKSAGWEFDEPEVLEGIIGDVVGVPSWWKAGGGAWGLNRVVCSLLEKALMNGWESLLVFEDDVCWVKDAWEGLVAFWEELPTQWDALLLGGQHVNSPQPINVHVARCFGCHRTHAWAIRGQKAMKELLGMWYEKSAHIDHSFAQYQKTHWCYSPVPFAFGQRDGKSDISGRQDKIRYWDSAAPVDKVLVLRAPRAVKEGLQGFHGGHWKHKESGLDNGLIVISTLGGNERLVKLKEWIVLISNESAHGRLTPLIWHPSITAEEVRTATNLKVVEIEAATVDEVLKKWSGE